MVSKYFLFSPLPGEMIKFDEHIFQMGWWKNHQLVCHFVVGLSDLWVFPYQKWWDFVEESRRLYLRQRVWVVASSLLDRKVAAEVSGGFGSRLSSEATKGADLLIVWMLRMMVTQTIFVPPKKNSEWFLGKGYILERTNMQLWKMCSFQGFCWGFILECSPPVIP